MGKIIDITNQKFGDLTVISPSRTSSGRFGWKCKCDCGNTIIVESGNLRSGRTTSCGCKKNLKIGKKNTKNLIGQTFGKLTVLEKTDERICGAIAWKCKCECGNEVLVATGNLKSGHTKSCGCLKFTPKNIKDLTGKVFGKLTVLKFLRTENYESIWLCRCECGNFCEAIGWHLTKGLRKSCGCLRSKGELAIQTLLQEYNIPFVREKSFDTCRFPETGALARFDFYVNNEYLIEFDGIQHFKSYNRGWSTEEQLLKTQLNDKYKDEWCKNNNIPLIRIKYDQLKNLTIQDLLLDKGE